MRLKVLYSGSGSGRVLQHILFWCVVTFLLSLSYRTNLPDLKTSFITILFFVPIHLAYFYTIAYGVFPVFLRNRKGWQMLTCICLCTLLAGLAFRIVDITVADIYYRGVMKSIDPNYVPASDQQDFWVRLKNPYLFVVSIEQTVLVVWISLALKFFRMWFDRRNVALQAELNFLKTQIHPHFLFNTLNNLYALTLQNSPQAPNLVMGLSQILRYMLYECNTGCVLLLRDIEILENYMALEKLRYEERLDLNFSISGEPGNHRIAPLLLLPLVENAFKHGAGEQVGDVWINIDLAVKGNQLVFKVSNSRPGITPVPKRPGQTSIGLPNTRKRLEILYPGAHTLKVFEEEEMFVVILELALEKHLEIAII